MIKGPANGLSFFRIKFFPMVKKHFSFDLKRPRLGFSASVIVVPGGDRKKSCASDVPGKGLGFLNLVFVVLKDNEFPVSNTAARAKCFQILEYRMEICSFAVQPMGIFQAV